MKVLKNPFEERIEQLINIDTGDCASKDVVMSLRSIESVGQNQYKRYVTEVHENQPYPLSLLEFGNLRVYGSLIS